MASPLSSLTAPERNMKRNSNQRSSHIPGSRRHAQKKRKEAGFEQKEVPLKAHELLTGVKEREIKDVEKKQT